MSKMGSRSEISIYNYPEYLNPFYESDNHKRLRFWKVEKKNSTNQFSGRRGSFTFGSLKSLLPFKTFGLKKRSSELGISKTSESPPALRRNFDYNLEDSNKYTTYDPHFRQSLGTTNKNAGSMQNMNEFSFGNRNNRYRRTIQNGAVEDVNRNYVYMGSVTPTLRSRYAASEITPGSSMNSINRNPFESDDENDYRGDNNLSISRKPLRKKRRAPLPPVVTRNKTEEVESEEFCRMTAALTAEFESFVKDDLEIKENGSGGEKGVTVAVKNELEIKENGSSGERKIIIESVGATGDVTNKQKIKENGSSGEARRNVEEKSVETKITTVDSALIKEVKHEPEVKEYKIRNIEVVERKPENFDENRNIETSQKSEKIFLTKVNRFKVSEEKREAQIKAEVSKGTESSQETFTDENIREETFVDHNSREETPDYSHVRLQMTVREKFHTLRIDENGNEQNKTKVAATTVKSAKFDENSNEAASTKIKNSNEIATETSQTSSETTATIENSNEATTATIETTFLKVVPSPRASKRVKVEQILETNERNFQEFATIKVEEAFDKDEKNSKKLAQVTTEDDSRKLAQEDNSKNLAQEDDSEKASSVSINYLEITETNSPEIEETNPVKNLTSSYQVEPSRRMSLETPIMFHESIEECVLRNREPPIPPQRRRSVKDIIESINRSQKLLKPNQAINPKFDSKFQCDGVKPPVPPKTNALFMLQQQAESEKRINALLADLQDYNK